MATGNASIRDERWRYIRYSDGTQELYDLKNDPQEWNNLAAHPPAAGKAAMKRLAAAMPQNFAPSVSNSKGRYPRSKELDTTIKATRDLTKLK